MLSTLRSAARRVGKSVGFIGGVNGGKSAAAEMQARNAQVSKALRYAMARVHAAEEKASKAAVLVAEEAAKTGVVLIFNSLTGVMELKHTSVEGAQALFKDMVSSVLGDDQAFAFNVGLVMHLSKDETVWAVWCNHAVFMTADVMNAKGYTHYCVQPSVYFAF